MQSNRPRLTFDAFDPGAGAAETDQEVGAMISQPNTAEARDWLDPAKYPNHSVREMPAHAAREMVAGLYERGAERVYVLEPDSVGNSLIAAQFAVKLPQDPCAAQEVSQMGGEMPRTRTARCRHGPEVSAHHD